MNQAKKELFILGSGLSINQLTQQEKDYINQCEVRIAVNKFAAFYQKAGVVPTHVYFVDDFSEASVNMLQYIFDLCEANHLSDLTFIVKKHPKVKFTSSLLLYRLYQYLKRFKKYENYRIFRTPPSSTLQRIRVAPWLSGDSWANRLDDILYHYRGSLTTVLNYVSICYPGYDIKMVGNDFNSSEYFFEKELQALPFVTTDWTTPIIKKQNKHFSAISHEGTTMFDKFDDILEFLSYTNNGLYVCNPKSLLATDGWLPYKAIMD